jgi:hypothetical protein
MTVNYFGILTLEIIGFFTAVIYHYRGIFITLGPGAAGERKMVKKIPKLFFKIYFIGHGACVCCPGNARTNLVSIF